MRPWRDSRLHFHKSLSESFFVLSGKIRLYDGQNWVDGRPGDFLYVPGGGLHGFRNESGEPASMLILFAPGAPREANFEGLAEIGRTGVRLSPEEMAEFYPRHHLRLQSAELVFLVVGRARRGARQR
jgi:Cupin domain